MKNPVARIGRELGPRPVRQLVATLGNPMLRGVGWQFAGVVANQGSTFAANLVLANVLGVNDFGRLALVTTTVVAASQLAQFGVGVTASKYVAEWRATQPERAGAVAALCLACAIGVALVAFGALAVAAPFLARTVLHAPDLSPALRLGSAYVPGALVSGVLLGILAGTARFDLAGRSLVASGVAYVVLCVAGGWMAGVVGALAGIVASAALQLLLLAVATRTALAEAGIRVAFAHAMAERSLLGSFALPGALGSLTSIPALWAGAALLARHGGPVQVALYSTAYSFAVAVLFLPGVVNTVVTPHLNLAKGRGATGEVVAVYRANLRMSVAVVSTIGIVVAVLAGPLLRLYGPAFSAARVPLYLVLAATLPEVMTVAMNQWIAAHARLWRALLQVNIPRDATIALVAALAVPRYGAVGMAGAYLTGRVVAYLASAALVARIPAAAEGPEVVARAFSPSLLRPLPSTGTAAGQEP